MKQLALITVWLLICIPTLVLAQTSGLAAKWSLNEPSGQVAHDSVSGTDDAIGGLFNRVSGVSGNGLRFDGESTIVTRGYRGVPQTTAGVTADAWVAVNTYPWNWVPIVVPSGIEGLKLPRSGNDRCSGLKLQRS